MPEGASVDVPGHFLMNAEWRVAVTARLTRRRQAEERTTA